LIINQFAANDSAASETSPRISNPFFGQPRKLATMLALLTDLNAWAALLTLTALEILLGIDNVVFVSLLAANLDAASGRTARQNGFALAFVFRIALLFALT
jgi:predicted tellurium resistance membrane protein TerC